MQRNSVLTIVLFTTAVAVCDALAQAPAAPGGVTPTLAPPSLEFLQQQMQPAGEPTLTSEGFGLGRRPSPLNLSHARGQQVQRIVPKSSQAADSPISYDLRTVPNKLPPVRNQGSCGDCWTFATFGSLETWLRPAETTWDFSEMDLNCSHGFDWSACAGGNREMATAFLTRWEGPALETCYTHAMTCTSPRPTCTKQKRVLDVLFLPDRGGSLDNQNIKDAVMAYGAVYTTYYDYSLYHRGSPNYSYYCSGVATGNHAVCIVGWDDNFDRTRFVSPNPPANGAFIVRNSWGGTWGQSGYFYISYYDANIGNENAVFLNAEPTTNYTRIYQHDPYGWISNTGYGETTWAANIFTAVASESIKAVAFYTPALNAAYEVYLYVGCNPGQPRTGTAYAGPTGTMAQMGYHTLMLNTPVPVSNGQRFSVVLKLTTPGYGTPICVEDSYPGYCGAPTASAGQSYFGWDGASWTDLTTYYPSANVCLRALVGASDTTPPTVTSVQAQTFRTIDITFSEPMGAGVTTAANYALSGAGKGSLTTNPNSVALVSGNTYRLTWTAGEMKNASAITVCATGVQDTAGNTIGGSNCGNSTGIGSSPTITACATPQSAAPNSSCQAAIPNFTAAGSGLTATDNVTPAGSLVKTQAPTAGTLVGLGVTTVTITVTDQAGNSSTCQTTFTVTDPDNDRVCGTADQCPNSIPGAIVDATGCSNGPGDFDRDGDVDSGDLDKHLACITGPQVSYAGGLPGGCTLPVSGGYIAADLDTDRDVDSSDFGLFQRCYSGTNVPSKLGCAN